MVLILAAAAAAAASAASAAAPSLTSTSSHAAVVPAVHAVPVVLCVGGSWPDSHSGAGGGAGVGTTLSSLGLLVAGSPVSPSSARATL
jgi:hypothetical protein